MADFRELQEGEIQVLKSIFMEDYESVVTTTPWKTVNAVQEFRICVRPMEEDLKDRVSVRIHFKLPLRYPKLVPTMTLEEPVGLSSTQVSALRTALQRAAVSLAGSEMVYELCSQAANFITDQHQAAERGKQTSLGDQRKQRSQEEEKATALATREADARERALRTKEEAAEAARLSGLILEDVRKKEEAKAEREKRELEGKTGSVEEEGAGESERRVKMVVATEGGEKEAVVQLGLCIAGDWIGRILPAEISLGQDAPFPASATVFDILAPYFVTPRGKRKLAKVESDLDRVRALRHPHLLTLHGSLLTPYAPSFFSPSSFSHPATRSTQGSTLIVLTEPLRSQTLLSLLHACGELRTDRALGYFAQVVGAVEYLHAANVAHRAIRPRSVFVGSDKGAVGVKLGEVAWFQRLVDLNKSDPWVVPDGEDEMPDPWICPGAVDDPFVYDKSRDMWDLGVLFAEMLFGLDVYKRYPSPADLVRSISRTSAPQVRKVLTDLLLTDSKKRPSAARLTATLLESSSSGAPTIVLSTTPKNSVWPLIPGSRQPTTPMFSPQLQVSKSVDAQVGFFWQPRPSGSRYRSEFEELEFLGRGGGGQVVKARNRLDGHLYAVKKIRLPNDRAREAKILREVTIWSRMNHPNIVRYHTSWVETDEQSQSFTDTDEGSTQPTETETDDSSDQSDPPSDFDEDVDSAPGNDLDMDLGLDDIDDFDFLSVGHSKSVSYPSIHFGNEDDASRPGSTVANSPAASRHGTRGSSPALVPKHVRTLYIQMEYVEKLTLREAIDDGVTEDDSWRLMRQILSAMGHFTSLNIIHRDLKPSNIFLDVNGDVRIGDFGLAVNQGLADPADVFLSVDSSMDEVDLTSGVGTSLYIAPESLSRGRSDRSVKYSNKIDMYSLGIIFFELCHPFKTGMERIQVLRDLRKPEIIFPSTWDATRLVRQTKIVQMCLVHDPELRVSPKDLENSDLLPARAGDDSIEATLRILSQSGTPHAQKVISTLFSTQTAEDKIRKDFSYDFYDGEGAKVDNDPYSEMIHDTLARIFRRGGAVCMDSPLLMPQSTIYASRNPVRLLDADGTIACLPFQLNIPFCRMVARDSSLTRLKRWTIAPVYRASVAGGQPRAVLNAAFDIVSDAVTAAAEAECIYVVDEIMSVFPFVGETVHYLNHSKILDAVVERVPAKRRPAVLEVLVQHGRLQRPWAKTAMELKKIKGGGISQAAIDEIGALDFVGTLSEVRARVLAAVPPRLKHIVQEGFEELTEIISLSHQLGVKTIKIAPLLSTNWDFHRDGVLFESHNVKGKTREVIAAGGRFDDVVSRLAAPEVRHAGRCPHIVGFSMSVAKLSRAAADANETTKVLLQKKEYGPWAVRRCDVYIISFAPNLVSTRLDIARDLWKSGIKADIMYDDNLLSLSPEEMVSACRREGIMWLVIVKPGPDRRAHDPEKTVKVKSVLRGFEEEVPRSELSTWLTKEMREHEPLGGSIVDAHAETSTGVVDWTKASQDYFPILADEAVQQKGKHRQRTMIIQRAQKSVEAGGAAAAEAPVFAFDVDGVAFRKMCASTSWISDDDAFRSVTQNAPPAKRAYLDAIRHTIQKQLNGRPPGTRFWLFSLRDDRSSLQTFEPL